jgi:hypothetical protein
MLLSSFPLISVCHCVNISNSFWYRNFDFVGTIWYFAALASSRTSSGTQNSSLSISTTHTSTTFTDELVQRDRDVQVQERRTRIRESRYNGKYEKIITEELPKYLGRESRKERVIIARFRCGNEERENKYWNEDRIRVCRMCGEKKETIEHMLNECVELRERGK